MCELYVLRNALSIKIPFNMYAVCNTMCIVRCRKKKVGKSREIMRSFEWNSSKRFEKIILLYRHFTSISISLSLSLFLLFSLSFIDTSSGRVRIRCTYIDFIYINIILYLTSTFQINRLGCFFPLFYFQSSQENRHNYIVCVKHSTSIKYANEIIFNKMKSHELLFRFYFSKYFVYYIAHIYTSYIIIIT